MKLHNSEEWYSEAKTAARKAAATNRSTTSQIDWEELVSEAWLAREDKTCCRDTTASEVYCARKRLNGADREWRRYRNLLPTKRELNVNGDTYWRHAKRPNRQRKHGLNRWKRVKQFLATVADPQQQEFVKLSVSWRRRPHRIGAIAKRLGVTDRTLRNWRESLREPLQAFLVPPVVKLEGRSPKPARTVVRRPYRPTQYPIGYHVPINRDRLSVEQLRDHFWENLVH